MPIQSAQPEVAANANPARRMPQAPERPPRKRSKSQGPAVNEMEVPAEKSAMMSAPSIALAESEATNNAEYSKPQPEPTPQPEPRPWAPHRIVRRAHTRRRQPNGQTP